MSTEASVDIAGRGLTQVKKVGMGEVNVLTREQTREAAGRIGINGREQRWMGNRHGDPGRNIHARMSKKVTGYVQFDQ
jgi:hypothetical protein